jgi:hypothetical protein
MKFFRGRKQLFLEGKNSGAKKVFRGQKELFLRGEKNPGPKKFYRAEKGFHGAIKKHALFLLEKLIVLVNKFSLQFSTELLKIKRFSTDFLFGFQQFN